MIIVIFSDKPITKLHIDDIPSIFDDSIEDSNSKKMSSQKLIEDKDQEKLKATKNKKYFKFCNSII